MKPYKKQIFSIVGLVLLSLVAGWIALPIRPDIKIGNKQFAFNSLQIGSWKRDFNLKLGLDLRGGAHLVYRADISGISKKDAPDALAGVRDVIERRVNMYGISEPLVQTNKVGDEYRVIVELAGVHNTKDAIDLIGATPQLDFRREVPPSEAEAQFNIDDPSAVDGPIFERTDLTGKQLKHAAVDFDQFGGAQVNLEFNSEGTALFAELTKQNISHRIAIYLDNVPIRAPVVQAEITNGQAVISGGFSLEEAKLLAQRLNAGALPVPIELIGQQTVGPTLGQQSIRASLVAGVLGLAAVVVWMLIFYRLLGVIASLSLALYAAVFIVLVKLLPVTLTLAGIAGIILSIGMAVDANVLIFERFRENIRRGKSVRYSLDNGFTEAWGSIKASNISSLITALILYVFGTSIIRGFAVTFSLGIVLSMFTAITVTGTLLRFILQAKWTQQGYLMSAKVDNDFSPSTKSL